MNASQSLVYCTPLMPGISKSTGLMQPFSSILKSMPVALLTGKWADKVNSRVPRAPSSLGMGRWERHLARSVFCHIAKLVNSPTLLFDLKRLQLLNLFQLLKLMKRFPAQILSKSMSLRVHRVCLCFIYPHFQLEKFTCVINSVWLHQICRLCKRNPKGYIPNLCLV